MPWIRLDDHFDQHPKIVSVGPVGMAMWVAGLAYCNRNLTDGFIPWSAAQTLIPMTWLSPSADPNSEKWEIERLATTGQFQETDDYVTAFCLTTAEVIRLLVEAGLWHVEPRGYRVHDYEDFQPSRASIEAEREQKRAAGKAGGEASAKARAQASAQAKSNPVPDPDPVPVIPFPKPEPREAAAAARTPEGLDAVQSAWRDAGHEVTPAVSRMMVQDLEAMPLAWVLDAIEEGVQNEARGWAYIRSILKRWAEDGREPEDVWAKSAAKVAAINARREAHG